VNRDNSVNAVQITLFLSTIIIRKKNYSQKRSVCVEKYGNEKSSETFAGTGDVHKNKKTFAPKY